MGGAIVALLFGLGSAGCGYDYSALGGRKDDAGIAGSGGAGGGPVGSGGSGGKMEGSGGQIVVGSGGRGAGGNASGGAGGRVGTGGGAGGRVGTGGGGQSGGGTSGHGGGAGTSVELRVLSVDFVGGRPPTTGAGGAAGSSGAGGATLIASPAMTPLEIAGFKPASHWNSAPGAAGSLAGLTLSSGAVTTANVTWNSPGGSPGPGLWTLGYTDAPGDARMMNGYLDPLAAAMPASIVVSDLPAAIATSGYDVYVYAHGDILGALTRTYRYTIGATSFTIAQTGPKPTTFPGFSLAPEGGAGNYIVFRNVMGASFTLTATPGTGSPTRAPVNGIQIVSPTGS
jgi:hypothetical protein